MDNSTPHFTIHSDRFDITLWRIPYHQCAALKERSFRVEVDTKIMLYLSQREDDKPDRLTLPKLLVTLETLFGKSSTHYDDSRQTFAFHFFLQIQKGDQTLPYLLEIADYRGSASFWLYRIIDHEKFFDYDTDHSHKEVPNELNFDDIAYLIYGIWMNLKRSGNIICYEKMTNQTLQLFFDYLDCEYFIYGYVDNAFFEMEFDNENEYRTAIDALREKCEYHYTPIFQDLQETQRMIQVIINPIDT